MLNGIMNPIRRVADFYHDRNYFTQLSLLAAPIALQNLLTSSLNMIGNVMIGQLGDVPIAAVALASQVFFLLNLLLFGIGSGSAMFTAQLWGSKDLHNLRKVLGLCMVLGVMAGIFFFLLSELFPTQVLRVFSEDPQVVAMGSRYLKTYAWAFLFFSVTSGFSAVLRSIGEVKLPMAVTVSALGLNILLNYILIFGHFGMPAMGAQGVAVSLVIIRIAECLALVGIVYRKKLPIAAGLRELLNFDLGFVAKVFKPVLPVIMNEILWSTAVTIYNIVYARIGTASIDAMNITSAVENLAFVPFMGLASALAIMTGNRIGAGEKDEAHRCVGRTLGLTAVIALLVGGIVLVARGPILSLYNVTPEVIEYTDHTLIILGLWMVIRSQNTILVIGTLRGGGDTRYSLFLDGIIIWILGVPMAILGGFVLHLPVYWVYLMVMLEELAKCILGLRRYFSRKWLHDLTQTMSIASSIPEA